MKSHQKMLLGIAVGTIAGLVANETSKDSAWLTWTVTNLTGPLGQIFLRLLFMLVVPMLFAALVMGVCELDLRQLGRLGARTMGYTVVFSLVAVVIGLVAVNTIKPGLGMSEEVKALARTSTLAVEPASRDATSAGNIFVSMVPDNAIKAAANGDMIGLIVFSLFFGAGLATLQSTGGERLREMIAGLYEVMMRLIDWVLKLAPLGVAALLFNMTSRLGLGILVQLAAYVGTVLLALALHQFGVYSLSVRFLGGRSPIAFFRDIRLAMVTAFATSSSSATLPTALKVAEENLRLPRNVSRFVLTAGSAMNQNGTALFEGVTVLFLAQLFGVQLSIPDQFVVMLICVLAGIGTAGVPAGSIPVIAMILQRFHIPVEGLGLILGVDRFLDMCRTTLNVTGDLAAAVYVARGEPDPDAVHPQPAARAQP
ncbi:dicarboxylate/amino acid:cation symporter [Aggregicoccus sp. 17bor-14]|uniref:dicarboxylate/amino acid:cation symporter n=1 Tax=Myxococcaceae TaxID=31 RepID=UPI00129CD07A|nr:MULTISPECIES: dicarboxylate/amino acid:cation symporter [Myxococcaceae]MBF5044828.1 dicarboxylate/amino acid:cation symporter [Simulacricoccus sp. 17bor-14]MRI90572.1 dicarboxylate/amino acid:cation symporter [Aggregicoccus sp. 17bor-14]